MVEVLRAGEGEQAAGTRRHHHRTALGAAPGHTGHRRSDPGLRGGGAVERHHGPGGTAGAGGGGAPRLGDRRASSAARTCGRVLPSRARIPSAAPLRTSPPSSPPSSRKGRSWCASRAPRSIDLAGPQASRPPLVILREAKRSKASTGSSVGVGSFASSGRQRRAGAAPALRQDDDGRHGVPTNLGHEAIASGDRASCRGGDADERPQGRDYHRRPRRRSVRRGSGRGGNGGCLLPAGAMLQESAQFGLLHTGPRSERRLPGQELALRASRWPSGSRSRQLREIGRNGHGLYFATMALKLFGGDLAAPVVQQRDRCLQPASRSMVGSAWSRLSSTSSTNAMRSSGGRARACSISVLVSVLIVMVPAVFRRCHDNGATATSQDARTSAAAAAGDAGRKSQRRRKWRQPP